MMNSRTIILISIVFLICIMFVFQKKVNLYRLFRKQLQVFRNDRTGKISPWDIISFIIIPVVVSLLIVLGLSYQIDTQLAEIFTTVFSLVFTILFGFAAVIVEKSENNDSKRRRVIIGETFVSIVTSTVLSLFAAMSSILLTKIVNNVGISILSVIVFAFSFQIIMLLLMITKRTFVIYCGDE